MGERSFPSLFDQLKNKTKVHMKSALTFLSLAAAIQVAISPSLKYQTDEPNFWCDEVAWTGLRPIMLAVSSIRGGTVKDDHWCHWREDSLNPEFKGTELKGDQNKMPRKTILDNLGMSLGWLNWDEVYQLRPKKHGEEEFRWTLAYRGFDEAHKINRLSIILNQDTVIKYFIGPGNSFIYGIDTDGNEVPLEVLGKYPRYDRSVSGIQI